MTRNSRLGAAGDDVDPRQGANGPATAAGPYAPTSDAAGNLSAKSGPPRSHAVSRDAATKPAGVAVGDCRYAFGADHARVLKVVPQTSGPDKVIGYLEPEAGIDIAGVWTNYVHDDVQRQGTGPPKSCVSRRQTSWRSTQPGTHREKHGRRLGFPDYHPGLSYMQPLAHAGYAVASGGDWLATKELHLPFDPTDAFTRLRRGAIKARPAAAKLA